MKGRYSKEHKAQTHRRIVTEASERFRRDGIDSTGLQTLMKALGLTHGGFYAHFKSKNALVDAALRDVVDGLERRYDRVFGDEAPLSALIDMYLSPSHRAHPETGCPLPTLSAELGQRGQASPQTDRLVTNMLARIECALPGGERSERSVAVLAALVGALVLSRSVTDPELSDRILSASRHCLIEQSAADADAAE